MVLFYCLQLSHLVGGIGQVAGTILWGGRPFQQVPGLIWIDLWKVVVNVLRLGLRILALCRLENQIGRFCRPVMAICPIDLPCRERAPMSHAPCVYW